MTAHANIASRNSHERIQERLSAARPPSQSLAETLLRLGRLNAEAIAHIEKNKAKAPFGKTAVKLGYLKPSDLEFALGVHLGFLHESPDPMKIPTTLVVARNPYSQHADEFRSLRTSLATGANKEALRSLVVTGTDEACDAPYVATNLAASFAQLGRKTLIVDANFRRPTLAAMFGENRARGITDVAVSPHMCTDITRGTMIRDLDVLPAGAPSPDTHRVLSDSIFRESLKNLALDYEVVIILTAPFTYSADCQLIWSAAEGALVVVKKDASRLADLEKLRRVLRLTETPLVGAVLSR